MTFVLPNCRRLPNTPLPSTSVRIFYSFLLGGGGGTWDGICTRHVP